MPCLACHIFGVASSSCSTPHEQLWTRATMQTLRMLSSNVPSPCPDPRGGRGVADQAPRIPTHSLRTGRVLALGFQVITSRQDSSPRSFKREKSAGTHFCFGVTFMHRSTACHNDDLGINLIDVDRRGESHLRSAHGCTIESAIVSQATLHQPRQPTNPKVRTPTG